MKRSLALLASLLLLLCGTALGEETRLTPDYPVPDYVTQLLSVADEEVGYREGAHGWTKYGEWTGDGYAQWCAEFLCWCVDQVDVRCGTTLLRNVYPMYSGSNTGRSWFIKQGRFVVRTGELDGWGYMWLKGAESYVTTGSYVPQPGDWVFFTWDDNTDTDHVAMVEYCTQDEKGAVTLHVIEGNNPVSVQRNTYPLTYTRILGYGTVHDVAEVTQRFGCKGEKVRQVQEKLVYLGFLDEGKATGAFGDKTVAAVRAFQQSIGRRETGIADIRTQTALDAAYEKAVDSDPATWLVQDE